MTELALVDGVVWRDCEASPAEAVLVRDGRIVTVGTTADVMATATEHVRVENLCGRMVLPAFTDSHTHFHRTAILREHFVDFAAARPASVADVVDVVRRRAEQTPYGDWIQGDNLTDSGLAERRFPDRHELDAAAPAHPVLLRSIGKHVAVANSAALRAAGIDRDTADPPGGRIDRDADGTPTGVLHERAKLRLDTTRADTVVPPVGEEERLAALRTALAGLRRQGITAIHEITRTPDEFADYLRLRERGELAVRVVAYVRVIEAQATLDGLTGAGLRTGFGDDWVRLGGVKVSIDGSCTFRNAAVYEPYPGEPDNHGLLRVERAELTETVRRAHAAGLQVAVHAIGPRAVDLALDTFAALDRETRASRRHRIEHAYLPPCPGQLERLRDLGLLLSTQPSFLESLGDTWVEVFGEEAAQGMLPVRTALDLGIRVQANSDCPTSPTDPLVAIRAAVRRRTSSGRTLGRTEAVTVREAVRMLTAAASYSAFEEDRRGRIAPGMLADLAVLSADPRVAELDELTVDMTVVDGLVAHRSGAW